VQSPDLAGRSILIVEDEPLIALDVATAFKKFGADVTTTGHLKQALVLVEVEGWSAAIVDHTLNDGDSETLFRRLKERDFDTVVEHLKTRGFLKVEET
jgi:DNA-binding response OmpR family regulator